MHQHPPTKGTMQRFLIVLSILVAATVALAVPAFATTCNDYTSEGPCPTTTTLPPTTTTTSPVQSTTTTTTKLQPSTTTTTSTPKVPLATSASNGPTPTPTDTLPFTGISGEVLAGIALAGLILLTLGLVLRWKGQRLLPGERPDWDLRNLGWDHFKGRRP